MDFDALRARIARADRVKIEGRVVGLTGLTLRAVAPVLRVGELVTVARPEPYGSLAAEVVGFDDATAILMPLGNPAGVGLDDPVHPTGAAMTFPCGPGVLGRVLDGLGQPLDGAGAIQGETVAWPVDRAAPIPMTRPRIDTALPVGVRAIDALLTLGEGQRVGLFAGPGAGKTTLLSQMARNCDADVVVMALVGERGREVREFVERALDAETRARSCVVAATSDAPALVRLRSAMVATSVAEFFRDRGARVLLLVDSLTRVARAQREIGLAAGEPPARRGFPPSVFALIPRLLERAGRSPAGSITGIYSVLVEGLEVDDPVAEDVRAVLDGHIVLDARVASRGVWPAVDVLRSLSRVMEHVTAREHRVAAARMRELLGAYDARRDLIAIGAYQKGADPRTDEAIARLAALNVFASQRPDEKCTLEGAIAALAKAVR